MIKKPTIDLIQDEVTPEIVSGSRWRIVLILLTAVSIGLLLGLALSW